MFKTLWSRRLASQTESKRALEAERSKIERQVEQFLDRIADTDVPSIVATYEKRIRDLEERKIVLAERIANCGRALPDFDEALKTPLDFLRNPGNLWDSPRLEDKRAVLKLAFAGRLVYTRNEGLKTPDVTLPFKVLEGFQVGKSKLARPEGFEPPTTAFEARYSIQLSYGRAERVFYRPWSRNFQAVRSDRERSGGSPAARPGTARRSPSTARTCRRYAWRKRSAT